MKQDVKMLLCIAGILCISISSESQILKDIGNRVKQKTQQRANQKIDQAIDKGLDKAEDAAKNKDTSGNTGNGNTARNKTNTESSKKNASSNSNNQTNEGGQQTSFKTYSKFDFVPGEKVFAFDDFSQDAIGDFPVTWNTNSSGEVVTASGQQGHWLMVRKPGRFIPEYIKDLPDNFTFEYDVICNEKFSFYSPRLILYFLTGKR